MIDKLKLMVQFAALDKITAPLKSIRDSSKFASKEILELNSKLRALKSEQSKLLQYNMQGTSVYAKLGNDIDNVNSKLRTQHLALEKVNATMKKLNASRAQYDSTMRGRDKVLNAGASAGVTGVVMAAPILKIASAYAQAENAATQLKIAMMDSTGKAPAEFAQINALATKLGNRLPGTTAEYQDMMTMLIRQGASAKDIMGGLGEATANLGVLLTMPQDEAAKFSQQLKDATSTGEKDMMGLMDTIQRTFNLGVDSSNMLAAFKGLSETMDIMKKKGLEGTNALTPFVVMMDQAGMRGESAGNAINKVVKRSLDKKDLAKTNRLLKSKGIKLDFSNGKGEFGGIDKMMAELAKLKKLSTVDRMEALSKLYGDDSETNQVLSKMIDKGMGGYNKVIADMKAQADIQKRVNEQLGTLSNLWEAASGTFTNALVALGESISPELKAVTQWINDMSLSLQNWAKEHPVLSNAILKTVAVIAGLLIGVSAIALGIAAIMGPFAIFRYGLMLLTALAPSIGAVMGTIGLWVGGLLAAGYAGYKFGTLINQGIDMALSKIFGFKTSLGSLVFDMVQYFKTTSWSQIGMDILRGLLFGFISFHKPLLDKIKSIAGSIRDTFKSTLGIKSPSRVFAQLGNYTMLGLENGLGKGENGVLTQISATAKRMALIAGGVAMTGTALAGNVQFDSRLPLSAGSAAGGASSAVYNITINAADVEKGKTIAQQVAEEIQRIQSRDRAAQRSRLRDSE